MTSPVLHPVTGKSICLGRTLARRTGNSRARASLMHEFLATLPTPPPGVDYTFGIREWGMMGNDVLGDCTLACPGHLIQSWTASTGKEVTLADPVIVAAYSKWDGYVVGDPSTDNGGDILTVLQDWQAQGLGGYAITAHAEVNLTQLRIMQALYVFGGLNTGVRLPKTARGQIGGLWDVVGDGETGDSAPSSWGNHCVALVAADPSGVTVVTWGLLQKVSWAFLMTYFDEAHAIISPNFAVPIAVADLASDLQEVGM